MSEERIGVHIREGVEPPFMAFFDLEGFDLAISESKFTQEEIASTLIRHIRSDDPKTSLNAIRTFQKTLLDLARLNGHIVKTTSSVKAKDQDGNEIEGTQSTERIQSRLVQRLEEKRPPPSRIGEREFTPSVEGAPAPDPVSVPQHPPPMQQ